MPRKGIAMPLVGTPTFSPQGGGRGCPRKGEAMTVKLLKQQHSCTNADESATTTHYGLKSVKDRMPYKRTPTFYGVKTP